MRQAARRTSYKWWPLAGSEPCTTRTGLLPRLDNLAVQRLVGLYLSLTCIVSGMALFSREFIAVPDDRKGQIVFKWPDLTIRRFSHAIGKADEVARLVNHGR